MENKKLLLLGKAEFLVNIFVLANFSFSMFFCMNSIETNQASVEIRCEWGSFEINCYMPWITLGKSFMVLS